MIHWLRKISVNTELVIVIFIGFGWLIFSSTKDLFYNSISNSQVWNYELNNSAFYYRLVLEIIALSLIALILRIRHWKLTFLNLKFEFNHILIAFLLLTISTALFYFLNKIFNFHNQSIFILTAGIVSVVLIVILNSFYEEILLNGYLLKRLESYGYTTFVIVSLGIRLSYHLYQGPTGLLWICIIGLVFNTYCYKYKFLWPVVMAHAILNGVYFQQLYSQNLP